MMADQLSEMLEDFLGDKTMIKLINFKIKGIICYISSIDVNRLKNAEKYRMVTRIRKYLSNDIVRNGSNSNDTLLHIVARDGQVETAIRLLECGADAHAKNGGEETPIFCAIRNSAEMVKVLLNASKVTDWDLFREALLHGTEEIFRLLLTKSLLEIRHNFAPGAISTVNSTFDEFQNIELSMNIFLQHGLHLSNMEESYPLLIFFAARMFRKDILRLILEDCRKNLETIKRKNLRSFKKKRNIRKRRKIKWYELRAPEELNVKGSDGGTGLLLAIRHQLLEVARFLLEEGADPNCHDYDNVTPLYLASAYENKELCQLLLSFNANANPNLRYQSNPLNIACCNRFINPEIIKLLLENGADPMSRSKNGVPALLQACQSGLLEVVKILEEYGANVGGLDRDGNSALHHTALGPSLEIVDFLLEKGLDINVRNNINSNYTPLMYTLKYTERVHLRMIEKLVSCGADINAMNDEGETALHIAIYRGTAEEVECLLRLRADWKLLDINQDLIILMYADLSMAKAKEVLISFIALRGDELENHIKLYVRHKFFALILFRFEKLKLEVTKLRTMTISENNSTTYFDFLTKDFYSAVQVAKNSDFKTFFDSKKYKNEFPFCARLLEIHFRRTQELENFVDETVLFILNRTNFPIEIAEMIMRNLSFIDFRVFGSVLSSR